MEESMTTCRHKWSITNVRSGYLVVEGCHRCKARTSHFFAEPVAPVDEWQEGEHFWTYLGSAQAVKFDLTCDRCGETVRLDDVMGLMLSTCQDAECEVARTARRGGPGTWAYVAFCADSTHASGKCISEGGIRALNEYFNASLRAPDKRIVVVPCRMCCNIDTCVGVVIADVGLTEIY